jgi:hypothetical protein
MNADAVWKRIKAHVGEPFQLARGGEFTYEVRGNVLRSSRTDYNLSRINVEHALSIVPIQRPSDIAVVRGPSYVYAILMDPRIRAGEW